jgi:hypothetical protein
MNKKATKFVFFLVYISTALLYQKAVTASPLSLSNTNNDAQSYSVDIDQWCNNKAFGDGSDFDGFGTFYSGSMKDNKNYLLLNYNTNLQTQRYDNMIANGQVIPFSGNKSVVALYMLVSASHGPLTTAVKVTYSDGSQDTTTLSLPDWQDAFANQMERYQVFQYPISIKNRKGALLSVPIFVNPTKSPVHLNLPQHDADAYETMHIFSMTAYSSSSNDNVIIASAQSTNEWINSNQQIVQVKVHNASPYWIRNASVKANNKDVITIKEGFVEAIAPGHIQIVQVILQKNAGQDTTSAGNVTITLVYKKNGSSKTITKETNAFLTLQSTPDQYVSTTK